MCHPLLRLWRLVEWQALWFKRILCRIWYVTIFFLHIAVKGVNLLSCLFPNRNGSFTRNFDAGRQNLIRLFWCSNHNRRLLTLGVRTLWNILWQADRSKTFLIFFFFFAGENFLIRTKGRNCIAICHTRECQLMCSKKMNFGDARMSRARLCHMPPQLAMALPLAFLVLLGLFCPQLQLVCDSTLPFGARVGRCSF